MPTSPRTLYPMQHHSGPCEDCRMLQRVKQQLEVCECREQELRQKLGAARLELANKDRQLEVSKRMLARVAEDKAHAEAAAEAEHVTARKLEQRLSAALHGDNATKMARYKTQVVELTEGAADLKARLSAAEQQHEQSSREVQVLKCALGLQHQLPDGVLDSHGKLLKALAQSQEESASLALALATKESALAEGAAALREAQAEVEHLLGARLALVAELDTSRRDFEQARQEAGEALELAAAYRLEIAAAKETAGSLQLQLQQEEALQRHTQHDLQMARALVVEEQSRCKDLADKLAALERSNKLTVEALHSEVSQALKRSQLEAAEQHAELSTKTMALSSQIQELQGKLSALQAQHAADQSAHTNELSAAHSQLQAARNAQQDAALQANSFHSQVVTLQQDVNRLKHEAEVGRAQAAQATEAVAEERKAAASLRDCVESLNVRLKATLGAHETKERALQQQVITLQAELRSQSSVSSRLQQQADAATHQAATSLNEYLAAKSQLDQLTSTVQQLTASKGKLQSGMLEQLGAFRDKLALVEQENKALKAALLLARSNNNLDIQPVRDTEDQPIPGLAQHRTKELLSALRCRRANSRNSTLGGNHDAPMQGLETHMPPPSPGFMHRVRQTSRALRCEDSDSEEDAGSPAVHSRRGKGHDTSLITDVALRRVQTALKRPQ